jgi:hypothetical protein
MQYLFHKWLAAWFIVLNVTFNNISVISWRSVILVEETGVPGEDYISPWSGFELTTLVVIGIDCIGSGKSNYHTITTTTAPFHKCDLTKIALFKTGTNITLYLFQWKIYYKISIPDRISSIEYVFLRKIYYGVV